MHVTFLWPPFLFLFFSSPQFQLVADLFSDKDDVTPAKSARVNVRALKTVPKAPNKEHRKTVGHQVSSAGLSGALWCFLLLFSHISVFFSSGRLCICSWTPWMLRLLTTCAASNPTTSKRPSRESARLVFYLNLRKWSEVVHAESVQNADEFIVAQPNRTSRSDITEVMTNRFCMGVRTSTCSNRIHFQLNSYLFKQKKNKPKKQPEPNQ